MGRGCFQEPAAYGTKLTDLVAPVSSQNMAAMLEPQSKLEAAVTQREMDRIHRLPLAAAANVCGSVMFVSRRTLIEPDADLTSHGPALVVAEVRLRLC